MASGPDAKVLHYFDCLLRQADLDLLAGPCWLNDQVIAFYFEYLAREVLQNDEAVLLVPGATTFLLLNCGSDVAAAVLEPLHFASRQLVLFSVNDNPDVGEAAGGSHWSLLCYSAADNAFRHYDSAAALNSAPARRLHRALQSAVPPGSTFAEQEAPQQRNAHDCGMFVLAGAEALCRRCAAARREGRDMDFRLAKGAVDQQSVAELRASLHRLVLDKAAAQRQQQRQGPEAAT